MIKYLYVLVSDEADYYLEQALLSITSLKMRMPNAFVSLLIDDKTESTLTGKRRNLIDLIDELKVIEIDRKFNKKARSRWLKTSMRNHIEGDFLYIDCDTIIADDLADIVNLDVNIGAVLDWHRYLDSNPPYKTWIQKRDRKVGFVSSFQSNTHFNSGIIFCKDVPIVHDFFNEWHRLWLLCAEKGFTEDQISFNQADFSFDSIIREFDGIWNCQIYYDGAIIYLSDSKIIHCQNSGFNEKIERPYLFANTLLFQSIKENGITEQIKEKLQNPRVSFTVCTRLIIANKFIDSLTFVLFNKMFNIGLLGFFEFILIQIIRVKKLFHKIISFLNLSR
jgi:hypothetical protein